MAADRVTATRRLHRHLREARRGRGNKLVALVAVKDQAVPKTLYRVGRHSPGLHTYPLWARWLIRGVYFLTGYQVTSEDIAIATSEREADAMCLDASYFYKPLYVDSPLPSEKQCGPGPTVWPRSEANELYAKHFPDGIFMTRSEFEALKIAVERVCD